MLQIDAASGCEVPWGSVDDISRRSARDRMRSRGGNRAWGPTGMDMAVGMKNAAGGAFLTHVVKETIGRGRGRVLVPVDITVSVLDMILVGQEVGMDGTYKN